ncbi:hypothetical protein E2C01_005534 [Portunus trituberculatus]|uniref:Uncharacterized protein n=1 Tax=Portunus trituberculatus TaxID=210409 RepID=A0A5B7CZE3_PORTR|nr:hypothetical protein [Portunus trituberculatus]
MEKVRLQYDEQHSRRICRHSPRDCLRRHPLPPRRRSPSACSFRTRQQVVTDSVELLQCSSLCFNKTQNCC